MKLYNRHGLRPKKLAAVFCTVFFLFCQPSQAFLQVYIKGKVLAVSGKPIPNASVFFTNTSAGTAANAVGEFQLRLPGRGRFDLVVSSVGFETRVLNINSNEVQDFYSIVLQPVAQELDNVVVDSYTKETWEMWGNFFLENFIGTTPFSKECKLLNNKAVSFRYYKKQRQLKAFANEPLIIENRSLGYRISFQLELFQYDMNTRMVFYIGYPLFTSYQKEGKPLRSKWEKNRATAYWGSKMHFMRSLYRNELTKDGFELRVMEKIQNTEKQRIRSKIRETRSQGSLAIDKDSSAYFNRILAQPDEKDSIHLNAISADSVAFAISKTLVGLAFDKYLHITYLKAKEHPDYLLQKRQNRPAWLQTSTITLVSNDVIQVQADGSFYDPMHLLSSGYWSWSDNVASLLPLDYVAKREEE